MKVIPEQNKQYPGDLSKGVNQYLCLYQAIWNMGKLLKKKHLNKIKINEISWIHWLDEGLWSWLLWESG